MKAPSGAFFMCRSPQVFNVPIGSGVNWAAKVKPGSIAQKHVAVRIEGLQVSD